MKRKPAIFWVTFCLVISACEPAPTAQPQAVFTPPAAIEAAPTPSLAATEDTSSLVPPPTPTPVDLAAILIAAPSLPAGWELKPVVVSEPEGDRAPFLCTALPRRSTRFAQVEFIRDGELPELMHRVALYTPGDAPLTFEEMLAASQQCTEWDTTDPQGNVHHWKAEPLPAIAIGDQALELRITIACDSFGSATRYALYWRAGDTISTIQHIQLGETEEGRSLVEELALQAAAALK